MNPKIITPEALEDLACWAQAHTKSVQAKQVLDLIYTLEFTRQQLVYLAERCAGQSELLTQRSEAKSS